MRRPEETHKRQTGPGAAGRRGRAGVAQETLGGRYGSLRDPWTRAGQGRVGCSSREPEDRPEPHTSACEAQPEVQRLEPRGSPAPSSRAGHSGSSSRSFVLEDSLPPLRARPDTKRHPPGARPSPAGLVGGAGRPEKSAGPWKEPIAAAVGRHPRTTTPDPHRAPGTAPSFRPGGVARPCGSGSPRARFTAPCAPQARRSRGAPAGRYATEAA